MSIQYRTVCLITGCKLETPDGFVPGDLFVQGDRFIFNSVVENGQALYLPSHFYSKTILLPLSTPVFERRGVFVFPASRALLNDEANAYTSNEEIPA